MRTYTHPDVFAAAQAGAAWADPETDPARIDWTTRQAAAAIAFEVVDGRPVKPGPSTGIRYGRNELGHWGEQLCADALVRVIDLAGRCWVLMVERSDGHGWALPGGYVDPGEDPIDAAVRELHEEAGLVVDRRSEHYVTLSPRLVPDPRSSDEAWMVTAVTRFEIGDRFSILPTVEGADDARRAAWVRADSYAALTSHLAGMYGGQVFAAHADLLAEALA